MNQDKPNRFKRANPQSKFSKLRNLITQHDRHGKYIYKYVCCECGSVDKKGILQVDRKTGIFQERGILQMLSQRQYDQLPEDEARAILLTKKGMKKKEIKRCPHCGEWAEFKRVRARMHRWEWEKYFRKGERITARQPQGETVTPERLKEDGEATVAWNSIVKRYKEIHTNEFRKGRKGKMGTLMKSMNLIR
jgi:hypothetical protein